MPNLKTRLSRLEASRAIARTLVVFSGGASSEAVTHMMEADHGIVVSANDRLLHFATIYESADGSPIPNPAPPRYVPAVCAAAE